MLDSKNNRINSDNCTLNKMRGQRGEKCRRVTKTPKAKSETGAILVNLSLSLLKPLQ